MGRDYLLSFAMILSTRCWCLPPPNSVARNVFDDLLVHVKINKATGKADHVAVVVLAEERRKLGRGNRRGADACDLIRRESHADTRTAYKHTVLSVSVRYRVGDCCWQSPRE